MDIRFLLGVFLLLASSASAQTVIIDDGATEEVLSGATLVVGKGHVQVKDGGTLRFQGDSASAQAKFRGHLSGANIDVLSGGTIDLKFARAEYLRTLSLQAGAKLPRLHDSVFEDPPDFSPNSSPFLNFSNLAGTDRPNIPFSLNRVSFESVCGGARVNASAGADTPLVRFLGNPTAHGETWGESFDSDPYGRLLWHTGAVTRTSPSGTFDTLDAALADSGTTSGSTLEITLGPTGFIDQNVDFNAATPTIRNACLAPMSGDAVSDSDGDSTAEGTLVNCVIARGGVSESFAYNCTIFNPTGTASVNNVTGTNLLIQSGFTGAGNVLTTPVTTATSAYFVAAAGYDFHLAFPNGTNPAIDAGSATSYTADWENDARGNDIPGIGSSPHWDCGADEVGPPLLLTMSRKSRFLANPQIVIKGIPNTTVYIYRWNPATATWEYLDIQPPLVTDGNGDLVFTDTGVSGDGSWQYKVSYSSGGTGLTASSVTITIDTTAPNAPTNCRLTAYNGVIDIEWDASTSPDTVGYRVYRKIEAGGTWELLNQAGLVIGTKYRDSGLSSGTDYYYRVAALDDALPY